ncbi:LysR family transcriptional regulator [Propionibacteriaceae bacterium Y1685]|uniref:LysR family transcriptional regulator n=1 Tax=Microlunatus sp. Y1700 TaxID=3418487 RepID=UPI003B7AAC57
MARQSDFDLAQLRTFAAVVTTGSFTRAAEQLGISQPTVSIHIRRLEEFVGRQLLVRDTRTVTVTDNGQALLGFARKLISLNDEAADYFTGSAMSGRLRFGAADELAVSELPTILRAFRQHHPGINLELVVTQSGVLQRRLAANHLDLIFINQAADTDQGQLVRRDRLVWVGLERAEIDEGSPVNLVTYSAPSHSRHVAISALEAVGRQWKIVCNTREVNGLLAAVRAGLGICVLAQSRIPDGLQQLSGRFGLPHLPDIEMALLANPRSAKGPVEALSRAILNLPVTPIRR